MTRPLHLVAAALALLATTALAPGAAKAVEPTSSIDNQCGDTGGRDATCATDDDCAQNQYATVCVRQIDGATTCQAPCNADEETEAAIREVQELNGEGLPIDIVSGIVILCASLRN